jgi:tight adherence protein C
MASLTEAGMVGMAVLWVAEVLLAVGMWALSRRSYAEFILHHRRQAGIRPLTSAALLALDASGLVEKAPRVMGAIQYRMILLYDSRQAAPIAKLFAARVLYTVWLAVVLGTTAGLAGGGDWTIVGCGIVAAGILPPVMIRGLDRKLERKKRQIIMALPEFLNKLALLVNAGETIQQAVVHCAERMLAESSPDQQGKPSRPYPWFEEMRILAHQLANRVPFVQAMENLGKRCAVQEVTLVTTTILLNHRRGGEDLLVALRGLGRELWERRKATVRTLGEEASAKLVFPMVLIFFVVLVIVAAPAVLMMNNG